jgi:hypothetical protein
VATAESGPLDELQRARVDLVRGQIELLSTLGNDAPPLLLKAAQRLERLDPSLARDTYLDAWGAGLMAGGVGTGGSLLAVSRAARSAPHSDGARRPSDLLLASLTPSSPTVAQRRRRCSRRQRGCLPTSGLYRKRASAGAGRPWCRAMCSGMRKAIGRSVSGSWKQPATRPAAARPGHVHVGRRALRRLC